MMAAGEFPQGQSPPAGARPISAPPKAEEYLPLVRRIAMRAVRTLPSTVSLDDIISAGWVGLSEAYRRRTPDMTEDGFEAFASYRVRGAILDYLRSLDPLSRKLRGASRRITEAVADLTRRHGKQPEEQLIASELGLELEAYRELLREIGEAGLVRLDVDLIDPSSHEPSPEAQVLKKDLATRVADAIDGLPERLRTVLALYYQEECTLREIGEVLGVTESRACQLHSEAIHRIRAVLQITAR